MASSSARSREIWRSSTSTCERTEMYSPAAIEKAPASSPAIPDRRMIDGSAVAPATPMMSERLLTRPSDAPKTIARRVPAPPRCQFSALVISATPAATRPRRSASTAVTAPDGRDASSRIWRHTSACRRSSAAIAAVASSGRPGSAGGAPRA